MSWSLAWSIVSVVVSIVIGLGTYWFAQKKTRQNRRQAAKKEIAQRLSLVLSEDNIPTYQIIKSTIRSTVRAYENYRIAYIRVSEIIDDLISQVTSAHFLDADRRKQLQEKLLAVLNDRATDEEGKEVLLVRQDEQAAQVKPERVLALDYAAAGSFLAAIAATLAAGFFGYGLWEWIGTTILAGP